jgi:hypothetical protein
MLILLQPDFRLGVPFAEGKASSPLGLPAACPKNPLTNIPLVTVVYKPEVQKLRNSFKRIT